MCKVGGIIVGDIVKIINRNLQFSDAFGEVTIVKDGGAGQTVCVKIHSSFRWMASRLFDEQRMFWCKPEDLAKQISYPLRIRATDLFDSRMWDSLCAYGSPLRLGEDDCCHKNCTDKATQCSLINVQRSVYEVYLCISHAEQFHGKYIIFFPWKKISA